MTDSVRAIAWTDDGLRLLDQRLLPGRTDWIHCADAESVAGAIRSMVVRGAPAIGISAAYGVALAARLRYRESPADWRAPFGRDLALLREARPTAVNLEWAVARMDTLAQALEGDPFEALLAEARRIHDEDVAANRRMGEIGSALIGERCDVLTHCNAGALATGGYGTALGVIRSAHAAGKVGVVYADETRPWLQGARLTAWELVHDGIPTRLLADSAASYAMQQGRIGWVIVGADRIAANGDVVNKIGTYSLAVNARHHGVGFMVAAPTSTVDLGMPDGASTPIELRDPGELLDCAERRVAAEGADAWNPVFDVTPAALVDAIVTERGAVTRPDTDGIARMMGHGGGGSTAGKS